MKTANRFQSNVFKVKDGDVKGEELISNKIEEPPNDAKIKILLYPWITANIDNNLNKVEDLEKKLIISYKTYQKSSELEMSLPYTFNL